MADEKDILEMRVNANLSEIANTLKYEVAAVHASITTLETKISLRMDSVNDKLERNFERTLFLEKEINTQKKSYIASLEKKRNLGYWKIGLMMGTAFLTLGGANALYQTDSPTQQTRLRTAVVQLEHALASLG